VNTLRVHAGLKRTFLKALAVVACGSAPLLIVSVTGCASHPRPPSTIHQVESNRTTESGYNQRLDQHVEDSRTAGRVREALAAGADYKYDGVKVVARDGGVQLTGFVNTSVQRNSAAEVTSKVAGVQRVQNDLTVKD